MHNTFILAVLGLMAGVILMELVYGGQDGAPSETRDAPHGQQAGA